MNCISLFSVLVLLIQYDNQSTSIGSSATNVLNVLIITRITNNGRRKEYFRKTKEEKQSGRGGRDGYHSHKGQLTMRQLHTIRNTDEQ